MRWETYNAETSSKKYGGNYFLRKFLPTFSKVILEIKYFVIKIISICFAIRFLESKRLWKLLFKQDSKNQLSERVMVLMLDGIRDDDFII